MKTLAKKLLQKTGLFPVARSLYRSLDPQHRRSRQLNARFYGELVRPGDLCFDIGANVGQTIEVLTDLGARVVAVEPNPECMPVLNFQFAGNPNVTIVEKAAGSARGFADLHFHGTESTASIREDWPFKTSKTITVPVTTLDDLIAEYGTPAFLKVDVEGFELEVFRGLTQPVPTICFEMHGNECETTSAVLDRISSLGKIVGVNAATGDNSRWIGEWTAHREFFEKFDSDASTHANIIVRVEVEV